MGVCLEATTYFPKILRREKQNVLPFFNCLIPPVGAVLRSYGYGDSLDFILTRNFNFYWGKRSGTPFCGCELFPLFEDIGRIDNIKISSVRYDDSKRAVDKILLELGRGIPQVVLLDEYYLKEYIHYNKKHYLHFSLLCGIDASSAYLDDIGKRKTLLLKDFNAAMTTYNFALLEFQIPDNKTIYNGQLIRELISRNIYYGLEDEKNWNRGQRHSVPAKGEDELHYGTGAVRSFSDCLLSLSKDFERATVWEILSSLGSQIYDIVVQRYWHLAFLDASRKFFTSNENAVLEAMEDLKDIVQGWNVVRNMCHKASVSESEDMVGRIAGRVRALSERERAFLQFLVLLLKETD